MPDHNPTGPTSPGTPAATTQTTAQGGRVPTDPSTPTPTTGTAPANPTAGTIPSPGPATAAAAAGVNSPASPATPTAIPGPAAGLAAPAANPVPPAAHPAPPAPGTPPFATAVPATPDIPGAPGTYPPAYARPAIAPKPKRTYEVNGPDIAFAFIMVILGYLACNWLIPRTVRVNYSWSTYPPGVAVTLFTIAAVGCSLAYFVYHKLALSRGAIIGAVVLLASALPFAIYDTTPVLGLAIVVLAGGFITWHAYAARTAVSRVIGARTAADLINQGLIVPFSNLGSWFASVRAVVRNRHRPTQVIVGVIGVVIALPLFAVILALLTSADSRFSSWMDWLGTSLAHISIGRFIWQFLLGLVVAVYLFGLLYGNAHKTGTGKITSEEVDHWSASARKINQVAIVAPQLCLCLIYVVFLAAMGSYLFAGFSGHLPDSFSYAQYARQGFFQLTAVAGINLAVLGFTYLFARRTPGRARKLSRLLGTILSVLTILLICTAISKMVLYVSQYGLTRLRLYTLFFMVVLFIIFALLTAWHIHPFRISTPAAVIVLAAFLCLTWANTDGIIADYNVSQYLAGQLQSPDADYLTNSLSPAASAGAIAKLQAAGYSAPSPTLPPVGDRPWTAWNWQAGQAAVPK